MGKPNAKTPIACPRCNAQTFDDSRKCWRCGKPLPRHREPFSLWRVLKLLIAIPLMIAMLAVIARITPEPQSPRTPVAAKPRPSCPPIEEGALWLPDDKAYAMDAFIAKANRLNASGVCVLDGSWGIDHQKFYYSVSKPEDLDKAWTWRHARYTYSELSQ